MTSNHGLFRDHPPPNKQILVDWLDEAGGYVHPGIEIADIPNAGWGLISRQDLSLHELLYSIPTTSILSARNSSLSPLPDSQKNTSISAPLLDLALCVLHELRLEKQSRWYGYLQSLPRDTILLPMMWEIPTICGEDGRDGLKWLKGTEAERDMIFKSQDGFSLMDLKDYYYAHISHLPLTTTHLTPSPFEAYLYAFSIITTRAFLIDLYHTIALVPFADILNHSSIHPHTSLSSDSFVCHQCGSLPPCSHDIRNSDGIPYRLLETFADPHEYNRVLQGEHTVDMRIEKHVEAGKEVFNSYGEDIGDARLLTEWGYLGDEFAGDGLTWKIEELGGDEKDLQSWTEISPGREDLLKPGLNGNAINVGKDGEGHDGDEDSSDRLFAQPVKGKDSQGIFNLSQSGHISTSVWTFLYLIHSRPALNEDHSIEAISKEVQKSLQIVEDQWTKLNSDSGDSGEVSALELGTKDPAISNTVNSIVNLLRARLAKYHRPEMSLAELFDLRDELHSEYQLQHMAICLTINERSLLEATLNRWEDLLDGV